MKTAPVTATEVIGPDARGVGAVLDGIPGAYERARLGLKHARAGKTIAPDELEDVRRAQTPRRKTTEASERR